MCLSGHFKDFCNSRVWLLVLVRAFWPDPAPSVRQREEREKVQSRKPVEEMHGQNKFREHRDPLGSF